MLAAAVRIRCSVYGADNGNAPGQLCTGDSQMGVVRETTTGSRLSHGALGQQIP